MFTGIIIETGRLLKRRNRAEGIELEIQASVVTQGATPGDSIAVDGCCLTIERLLPHGFTAFASPETISRTVLGQRAVGAVLNLEPALTLSTRLGGHLVQGHVDGLGQLARLQRMGDSWELELNLPEELAWACVEKGSITLDGISLTIARLNTHNITIAVIPATYEHTNLKTRRVGDEMNVETDIIGKYVRRFLERRKAEPSSEGLTFDKLRAAGFAYGNES